MAVSPSLVMLFRRRIIECIGFEKESVVGCQVFGCFAGEVWHFVDKQRFFVVLQEEYGFSVGHFRHHERSVASVAGHACARNVEFAYFLGIAPSGPFIDAGFLYMCHYEFVVGLVEVVGVGIEILVGSDFLKEREVEVFHSICRSPRSGS